MINAFIPGNYEHANNSDYGVFPKKTLQPIFVGWANVATGRCH